MHQILRNNKLVLMEAAIVEQLRRSGDINLHPALVNAPLIYDDKSREKLFEIYQGYMDISLNAGIPFLMCTPTWRANQERVCSSNANHSINTDAVNFMREIRNSRQSQTEMIKIGGLIGCKNDCYKAQEGLSATESEKFHTWQINQLAKAQTDFLIAETLPSTSEASGIAKAMEKTGIPYIISFVINRNGKVLDGADLKTAIDIIDSESKHKPFGYMINCAYPTFLCAANQPPELFRRLIGYLGNASSLDHCDLDGANQLQAENVADWGAEMLKLNRLYGLKILGGCCGSGNKHLQYLAS